jgi:hypothetical protein
MNDDGHAEESAPASRPCSGPIERELVIVMIGKPIDGKEPKEANKSGRRRFPAG